MSQLDYEYELDDENVKQDRIIRTRIIWFLIVLVLLALLTYFLFSYREGHYYRTYIIGVVASEAPVKGNILQTNSKTENSVSATNGSPVKSSDSSKSDITNDSPVGILRSAKVLGGPRD